MQLNPKGCQDAGMPLLPSQTASHILSKGGLELPVTDI